jgi:SagB-type dehydrogenase family enzyme
MRKYISLMIFLTILIPLLLLVTSDGEAEKKKDDLTIGERFHAESSLTWSSALGDIFRPKPKKPPLFKRYRDAEVIKLPAPSYRGIRLEEAIYKRRSIRNYSSKAIDLKQLSQLLFAAQGKTSRLHGIPLRTAPSAGALYPFEIYVIANNVKDLSQGIYHYSVPEHALELIKEGDYRKRITNAGLKQEMLGDSCVTFVMSAIFDRTRHKYGERGFRYVYIEAGHISQNIALQAVSLGLGSVTVGAFIDEQVNELIEVDGLKEAAIYLHAVGVP